MQITHRVPVDGAELATTLSLHPASPLTPVVLLHAGVGDRRMWTGAFTALAAQRTVLVIDRRGFGASRVLQSQPHAAVDDLAAVLDALALPRVELLGCSQGGRLAIDMALVRPERVAALTLVAPAVSGAPDVPLDGASQTLLDAMDAAGDDVERVNALEARLWLDGPGQAEGRVGGGARALFLDMNGIALRSDPGDWLPLPSAWERLEQLRLPVRLLCGELDLPMLRERCAQMARRIPNASLLKLPGMAHLPSLEAPQTFNAALHEMGVLTS